MDQALAVTETTPSESPGAGRGSHPNSRANLRPAWHPGLSGNPSGLTKDGKAPKAAKLEASLLAHLAKPGTMDRLAKRWIVQAMRGSFPHLNAILDRLYPVPQDQASGKRVLEGLKLEITPGGASLTMLRGTEGTPAALEASRELEEGTPRRVTPDATATDSGYLEVDLPSAEESQGPL